MNRVRLLVPAVLVVLATGCKDRPVAPALGNEPVYQSANEGFRFVAPEGWKQAAKAEVPAGPLEKERMLVRYFATTGEKAAALEVTMLDLPESADLAERLAEPTHGVTDWKPAGPSQPQTIHGVAATRFLFKSKTSTKDVVAFRRGGRVYLFTVITATSDAKTRELALKAIESVVWTK